METGQAIPNRYQIASRVTDDACVSHHSAFEYYGYANQVFYDVYFTTQKRVRPFSYDGVNYCPMACRGNTDIIKTDTGIRVTSLERTVIRLAGRPKNSALSVTPLRKSAASRMFFLLWKAMGCLRTALP